MAQTIIDRMADIEGYSITNDDGIAHIETEKGTVARLSTDELNDILSAADEDSLNEAPRPGSPVVGEGMAVGDYHVFKIADGGPSEQGDVMLFDEDGNHVANVRTDDLADAAE